MPIWPDLERVGERYQPSNGTEGEFFHDSWCVNCERDKLMNGTCSNEGREPRDGELCQILGASFRDGGAPEWVFGKDGRPSCIAFVPMGQPIPEPRCTETRDMFTTQPKGQSK